MSSYSDFIKGIKERDLKFFFGENLKKISNKYFKFQRIVDENNIILITNNVTTVKDNYVLLVDNNKAVYLKDWQVRPIHNYYNEVSGFAVKLNRNYFKVYTFKSNFKGFVFEKENNFDDLMETAKLQAEEDMAIALGF